MAITNYLGRKFKVTSIIAICLTGLMLLAGCWTKNIDTPYYTQDTNYYCGAASAQMILDSEKINTYVDQDVLYDYIHNHNLCSGWATDPEGLKDVLNLYYPAGYFAINAPSNVETGIKKIAYTIDRYGVPPASLVYDCGHWVVMRGVFASNKPTAASSFSVYGFFVNDPWYGTSSLGENKYMDINTWKNDYFTGCDWCAREGTRYISIVDPKPLPNLELILPEVKPRRDQIIQAEEIITTVQKYMDVFMKYDEFNNYFKSAPKNINRSAISTPILVKRSDKEKEPYYITPLSNGDMTIGAVLIDAYSGALKEFSFVKEPILYTPKLMRQPAIKSFLDQMPPLKIKADSRRNIRKKTSALAFNKLNSGIKDIRVHKMELVWEPSGKHQNPYYPLWKVSGTKGSLRGIRTLGYMDLDGKICDIEKTEIKGGGL